MTSSASCTKARRIRRGREGREERRRDGPRLRWRDDKRGTFWSEDHVADETLPTHHIIAELLVDDGRDGIP